jgi:hypothetical protein
MSYVSGIRCALARNEFFLDRGNYFPAGNRACAADPGMSATAQPNVAAASR